MSKKSREPEDKGVPRLDAMVVTGIGTLLNQDAVNPDLSLVDVERNISGRGAKVGPPPTIDPTAAFKKDLSKLSAELDLGLGLSDDEEQPGEAAASMLGGQATAITSNSAAGNSAAGNGAGRTPKLATRQPAAARRVMGIKPARVTVKSIDPGFDLGESTESGESGSEESGSEESGSGESGSGESGSEESGSESGDESEDEDTTGILKDLEKQLGIDLSASTFEKESAIPKDMPAVPSRRRHRISDMTAEQEQRRHIESVMSEMRESTQTSFSGLRERESDMKASKLEQIAQLRMALEDAGVNCSNVTNPTPASAMDEIDSVLNLLRLRNDRERGASMAEEVLLGGASILESVLDGTREIPVLGWSPDYTGYQATLSVKLHRMRVQTAQMVGEFIEQYRIGPGTRIALELLPSLLLYPAQQRRQKGKPGLSKDPAMAGRRVGDARKAYSSIRTRDEIDPQVGPGGGRRPQGDQDSLMQI